MGVEANFGLVQRGWASQLPKISRTETSISRSACTTSHVMSRVIFTNALANKPPTEKKNKKEQGDKIVPFSKELKLESTTTTFLVKNW